MPGHARCTTIKLWFWGCRHQFIPPLAKSILYPNLFGAVLNANNAGNSAFGMGNPNISTRQSASFPIIVDLAALAEQFVRLDREHAATPPTIQTAVNVQIKFPHSDAGLYRPRKYGQQSRRLGSDAEGSCNFVSYQSSHEPLQSEQANTSRGHPPSTMV